MKIQISHTLVVILVASSALAAVGQQPDRGFRSANTYAASGLDAVNMANGNLLLNIPIASLPTGRGGSPGYSVSLQYNSKLWKSKESIQDHGMPDENGVTRYSVNRLELSDSGGWRLTTGYNVRITDRLAFETPDPCNLGDPVENMMFRWKVELETPDGAIRPLYPRIATTSPIMSADGYAAVHPSGMYYQVQRTTHPSTGACMIIDNHYQMTTSGLTYITLDGSQVRVFIPYQTQRWKAFFPDGRLVENEPQDAPGVFQRLSDRNGNTIEHREDGICDAVGRCITVESDANGNTIVSVKGVGGETVSTRIEWGGRWIQKTYRITTAQNAPGFLVYETVFVNTGTVNKIKFPLQLGQQEMLFDYFGSEVRPVDGQQTEGWGELKSVTLPTGAIARFEYSEVGDLAAEVLERATSRKCLEYQEQYAGESPVTRKDVWQYHTSNWGGDVLNPNGAFSAESKHYNPTLGLWTNGLVYISSNPGNLVERIWAPNIPFTISGSGPQPPGTFLGAGSSNAYVKTEFTTPRSFLAPLNAASPTAIKDYKYDKNGNVLEIAEYDWVPYGSIPRSGGVITGLPSSGLVLKRKTINKYYNQAADASSNIANGNSYSDPSSPRLKNIIRSTEIRDGGGAPISRTEFYYDDPNNRGNLIETRTWDSTKGAYSPTLTAANSISTRSEYDQYGNVLKTTDARGVETSATYGDVPGPNGTVSALYPTQTVVASNYSSISRTSAAAYDFHTGLVTQTTDVDNDVSTFNEYDALGRSVRVRSAAGTAAESWIRTEYDDANRRVVVRSDVDAVGDGRKVATQFFDQLGRLRLTKTLEDATTQSAINETDGIKVETRYGYNDPTPANPDDPWNTLGSYAITSNPFRAPTAALAAMEQTMGWTRTYSHRSELYQESETFSGAAPPAPWGINGASTGVAKTEVDSSAITHTNQAGKKRRTTSDGVGQLIRVDEPNSAGELGPAAAPIQPTNYSYSAIGKLLRVQQGIQNRYFMYDSLGRLLRVRQPEQNVNPGLITSSNPGNNEWTAGFKYDNNGNLIESTDAKNVAITATYDALNRPTARTYSDSTPPVALAYDAAGVAYSKGKLTRIASTVSTFRVLGFDPVGRVTSSQQETDARTYVSTQKYNLSGSLVEQTYPSGRVVTNFTEPDGELAGIASRVANAPFRNYAAAIAYTPSGAIKHLQLGNGLWESAQFNSRGQVTEIALGSSPVTPLLWRLNYQYGELDSNGNVDAAHNAGNVVKQTISSSGLTSSFVQSYKYDSLDRIIDAREVYSGTTTWRQTFGYDRYGNRTSFSQTILGQHSPINSITLPDVEPMTNRFREEQGYRYDAAGNLIGDPTGRQFVFDAENKQIEVRDAQGVTLGQYAYDGSGKRIRKITATEMIVFVYDGLGKLIAEMSTAPPSPEPTVNYTATDTLGSPRVVTNKVGQIVLRRDFMPYGEDLPTDANYRTSNLKYGAPSSVRQRFTGYQRDSETGLDFAEARYYNQSHGRFTAVDPLLASGKSADPQTFNRYAYSVNRPTVLTDPSGLQAGTSRDEILIRIIRSEISRSWTMKTISDFVLDSESQARLAQAIMPFLQNQYDKSFSAQNALNAQENSKSNVERTTTTTTTRAPTTVESESSLEGRGAAQAGVEGIGVGGSSKQGLKLTTNLVPGSSKTVSTVTSPSSPQELDQAAEENIGNSNADLTTAVQSVRGLSGARQYQVSIQGGSVTVIRTVQNVSIISFEVNSMNMLLAADQAAREKANKVNPVRKQEK